MSKVGEMTSTDLQNAIAQFDIQKTMQACKMSDIIKKIDKKNKKSFIICFSYSTNGCIYDFKVVPTSNKRST